MFTTTGPDKETKYVILGEKAKAQLLRDSRKHIVLSLTELQKNPLNYTQVCLLCLSATQWLSLTLLYFCPYIFFQEPACFNLH